MSYTEGNAPIGSPGELLQFTMKQDRNGTDVGAEGHNTAVANEAAMTDMAPLIDAAEATASGYSDLGKSVMDGVGLSDAFPDLGVAEAGERP